jgi:predicted CopG family antitoxin
MVSDEWYNTYSLRIRSLEEAMQKKLTITIDENVYRGLHTVVGRGRISRFIENLVRPYVIHQDLDAAYREMAQDEEREAQALEWAEATIGDVGDEAR